MSVLWWIGAHGFFFRTHSSRCDGSRSDSSIKRSKRNFNKKINFVCLVCLDKSIFNVRFSLQFYIENTKSFSNFIRFFPLRQCSRYVHCTEMIEMIVEKTANFRKHADNERNEKKTGKFLWKCFLWIKVRLELLAFQSFIGSFFLLLLLLILNWNFSFGISWLQQPF